MPRWRRCAALRAGPVLAAALGAALAGCGGAEAPAGSAPDVLLVVVDTLRADALGAYGQRQHATPRIDALAREGVVFERAVAASTRTVPSHASLFTSRFVRGHSVGYRNGSTRLDGGPTLAEAFADAGYDTAAFVSNYLLQRRSGLDRGFALYDDELPESESRRAHILERRADQVGRRAVAWLERPRRRPYFLWVHFQDPHGPYEPPPALLARFDPGVDPAEPRLPILADDGGVDGVPAYQAIDGVRRASRYRARYEAEVAYVDAWFGRVLDAARAASARRAAAEGGPRQPGPIVLFTADHGEHLGEDDRFFVHGYTTLPAVSRVPLIVAAPGVVPARRGELVHHVDVLPTLLHLAGLSIPETARGRVLVHRQEADAPADAAPSDGSPGRRVVFTDLGGELGAWSGERYLRVRPERTRTGRTLRWASFTWEPGRTRQPAPPDPDVRRAARRYLHRSADMQPAPLETDEVERLRALGYAGP